MTNSKTIRDVMLPMRALNWLMGCGESMEYPLGNPHETISFLYSLFWVLIYYLLSYFEYYLEINNPSKPNNTERILRRLFFYFYLLFVPETLFMAWKRGKEMKEIFKNIQTVEKLLQKLKIRNEYAKMYKKQIFLTAFTATIVTILLIVSWEFDKSLCNSCVFVEKLVFVIRSMYPKIIMLFTDFSFISYTMCLEQKFTELNDTLQALSGTSCLYPQYMKVFNFALDINREPSKLGQKTNDDVEIIKIAKKTHLDLVKISKHINRIFGLHLLISIIHASILIIFYTYGSYNFYIHSNERLSFGHIFTISSWIISYFIRIIGINHICEKTSNEAMKTGRVICELHEPTTKQEFRSEIRDFSVQLTQNPLRFTGFGCITLDHTLILDIIGSITTYLIILIQLQEINEA